MIASPDRNSPRDDVSMVQMTPDGLDCSVALFSVLTDLSAPAEERQARNRDYQNSAIICAGKDVLAVALPRLALLISFVNAVARSSKK